MKPSFLAGWTLVALAALLMIGGARAGTPAHCEKPVCHMKSCQSFKNGKPNGSVCSNDCSKECCRCPQACNRH